MNAKDLRKKIDEKKVTLPIDVVGGKTENVPFYLLTTGDWAEVKEETTSDMWEMLMGISSDASEISTSGKSDEEIAHMQRDASFRVLARLDHRTQLAMFYRSLRRWDSEITKEEADYIVSYGLDRPNYMKAITFLAYGINPDQIDELEKEEEEAPLEEGDRKGSTTTKTGL